MTETNCLSNCWRFTFAFVNTLKQLIERHGSRPVFLQFLAVFELNDDCNMARVQMSWRSHCKLVFVKFPLQGELDRERFRTDLNRTVEMDTAYKADLRIFVSKGERFCTCVSVCDYSGRVLLNLFSCLHRSACVRLLRTFPPWA